jgi:acetyl esterase/lipase
MTDTEPGVRVDARVVPFPQSVSAEARAALTRGVGADGVPHNARHVLPPPDDPDAWRRLKAAVDAQYATAIAGAAAAVAGAPPAAAVETLTLGSATLHLATPAVPRASDCAYLDLHGGAFVFGGGDACRAGARAQADQFGVPCYGVDYRTPPDYPYPAALDDAVAAYRAVLEHTAPDRVVVGGQSAGGGLAAALLLRARDAGLPMPAGLVLLSPEVDLTESGDSFAVNRIVDVVLPAPLMLANRLYAAGADLGDPYLSPLFGDLAGLPPACVQSGTRDLFLSNAARMHRTLRRAGVAAELHVFEAMPHGGFGGAPEDLEAAAETTRFVHARLNIA